MALEACCLEYQCFGTWCLQPFLCGLTRPFTTEDVFFFISCSLHTHRQDSILYLALIVLLHRACDKDISKQKLYNYIPYRYRTSKDILCPFPCPQCWLPQGGM